MRATRGRSGNGWRAALSFAPCASSRFSPLEPKWEGFGGAFTIRVTKEFPDAFSAWLKSLPPNLQIELSDELASLQAEAVVGSVRLDVTESEIDWFDLRVVLDVNDTTLTQEELKLLLNARGGFVRLGQKVGADCSST